MFFSTIQRVLVLHIMLFNRTNPHNVIVLDNASVHHFDEVVQLLQFRCTGIVPFPPTPTHTMDYNPIEAFSKVKYLIKDYEVDAEM